MDKANLRGRFGKSYALATLVSIIFRTDLSISPEATVADEKSPRFSFLLVLALLAIAERSDQALTGNYRFDFARITVGEPVADTMIPFSQIFVLPYY